MYINADKEEPNCMVCINQDQCEGQQCGPEYAWQRYARYEDEDTFIYVERSKE